MKILIFGAGAIGSLFGGLLSKHNSVFFVGRKSHIDVINKKGLLIKGKTELKTKIDSFEKIKDIDNQNFDLIIISVKSFDTDEAVKSIKSILGKCTFVMSLQNGLDNIVKINKYVREDKIFVCVTTHGSIFSKPGIIYHTGVGKTKIGMINNNKNSLLKIINLFNEVGIKTDISYNIMQDVWAKGIINSCINPLTGFFRCKNGYILKNPVLEHLMEKVCFESTQIAKAAGFDLLYSDMLDFTRDVICDTSDNYSSMLQSIQNGKQTEIDSINGVIVKTGKGLGISSSLNELFVYIINTLC